jgi:hypothetical protein
MLIKRKHENIEFGYLVMHTNSLIFEIQYNTYVDLTQNIISTVNHPVILLNFKSTRLTFHLMGPDKCCGQKKGKRYNHTACYV